MHVLKSDRGAQRRFVETLEGRQLMSVTLTTLADPTDVSKTALLIVGDAQNEAVTVANVTGGVAVSANGQSFGTFAITGHVLVYGGGGNDQLSVSGSLPGVELYG